MVNPILNPMISLPLLKKFIFDPGRIKRSSPEQIKRYGFKGKNKEKRLGAHSNRSA